MFESSPRSLSRMLRIELSSGLETNWSTVRKSGLCAAVAIARWSARSCAALSSPAFASGVPAGEPQTLDKVVVTVDQHGNTSAASIPLALDHAVRAGQVKKGETLLLEGVGGGFTWGAVLLKL